MVKPENVVRPESGESARLAAFIQELNLDMDRGVHLHNSSNMTATKAELRNILQKGYTGEQFKGSCHT